MTGSPASYPFSSPCSPTFPGSKGLKLPSPTAISAPRAIPRRSDSGYESATPPLTPDNGSDSGDSGPIRGKQEKDALDFLMSIFPDDGAKVLPHAKSVSIRTPSTGTSFEGLVLQMPGKEKTLYVHGGNAGTMGLRERFVVLLFYLSIVQ